MRATEAGIRFGSADVETRPLRRCEEDTRCTPVDSISNMREDRLTNRFERPVESLGIRFSQSEERLAYTSSQ